LNADEHIFRIDDKHIVREVESEAKSGYEREIIVRTGIENVGVVDLVLF